ncbi:hypothetical protein MNBD_PLANCTO02-1648 [hydrothermal vent metagenome]|uniref:RNA polymerase sigma-70 region 2 domain-containing protein n=1 Tax=hydrothermal vent metagenome TaxID=652676 RepID=A0A3B1DM86_9ZZZZ
MSASSFSQSDVARLLMQYRGALYAYIHSCVRNHADAEDIFQDVSVAVVESISKLKTEEGFFPWAREIAFRRVLVHRRTAKKEKAMNPHVIASLAEAVERVDNKQPISQRRKMLLECMESLPDKSRSLIARRYDGSGDSISAIARDSEQGVPAIYAKLHRIRAILRDCISHRLSKEAAE